MTDKEWQVVELALDQTLIDVLHGAAFLNGNERAELAHQIRTRLRANLGVLLMRASGTPGTVVKVEAVGPVERHEVTLPAWATEEYRIKRVEPMVGSQRECDPSVSQMISQSADSDSARIENPWIRRENRR